MTIAADDFEYVRVLVRTKAGIVIEPGKEYMVDARLGPIVRREKLESIAALVARLRTNIADPLHRQVVEAMTTNETSFFRDLHPFEALRKTVLPALCAKRAAGKSLSIWCGASSTGQEPYTIAMTLREFLPAIDEWSLSFIATDLSSEMVARSKAGAYNQIEVNRGLPATLMVKYFEKQGLGWQIKEPLRRMIDFREMNLTKPWPTFPKFDIVFMRNVLIYFDVDTKKEIFRRLRSVLKPDGYLFLGGAETTMGLDDAFERAPIEKSGCYVMKQAAANAA
ncbi:MAG: protein-glutamate O-methyltransferase CheR [Planctomycetota bacterium]|nr:protein-glutamate O-methyltransferase CheR [Planctomycetota bacterium]